MPEIIRVSLYPWYYARKRASSAIADRHNVGALPLTKKELSMLKTFLVGVCVGITGVLFGLAFASSIVVWAYAQTLAERLQ